jgi:hypothetical protein
VVVAVMVVVVTAAAVVVVPGPLRDECMHTRREFQRASSCASGPCQADGGTAPAPGTAKRYLILTYASEFDRAHYPLPLAADADPPPAALRRTIDRLRAELVALNKGAAALRAENDALKTRAGSSVEAQIAEMAEAYERLRSDYEALRAGFEPPPPKHTLIHTTPIPNKQPPSPFTTHRLLLKRRCVGVQNRRRKCGGCGARLGRRRRKPPSWQDRLKGGPGMRSRRRRGTLGRLDSRPLSTTSAPPPAEPRCPPPSRTASALPLAIPSPKKLGLKA